MRRSFVAGGARLEGYVTIERLAALYRGAACVVQASRHEGFGLPVVEAMASGTAVVDRARPGARRGRRGGRDRRARDGSSPTGSAARSPSASRLAAAGLERARAFSWEAAARTTVEVYVEALAAVSVSAVVVSHGHADELETLLPALAPQVDELVVVANLPGSSPATLPPGARLLENARPRRLAENVNLGVRATSGEWVLYANPDAVPGARRGRGARRARGCGRDRCGIAGPRVEWPDGTWQPTRRRFPTVGGTLVRRTPLRLLFPPLERQRAHYHLDEDVDEPVEADWLLGAFLLMRRAMLDELGGWDEGYRHYVEDIDLCYRAMRAGWERWYVPAARVRHDWAQVSDRTLRSPATRCGTRAAWRGSCASTPRR